MKNIIKLSPVLVLAGSMSLGYDLLLAAPIATIYAIFVAMLVADKSFNDLIESAISSVKEIQIALFILMVAYALANSFMSTGVGASIILIALKIGVTAKTIALLAALITSILSIATGTSWGTFASCAPIFLWLNHIVGGSIPLTLAAIAGGSCFGDNIGLISETTIISSGIQNVEVIKRIRHQGVWAGLVLLAGLIAFYISAIIMKLPNEVGEVSKAIDNIPENVLTILAEKNLSAYKLLEQVKEGVPLYLAIPLLVVLFLAFYGYQTFICLSAGLVSAYILGSIAGTISSFNSYLILVKSGFVSAGSWVIIMMMWIAAFGGIMKDIGAFHPISKLVVRMSKSVRQLMFFNGTLCLLGNAALADEMAQIVTIGPIIKDVVDENVVGSKEDIYTLKLRNATFSDAMGVFGSQLIPWHSYMAFYIGTASVVYPLVKITALDFIKYNYIAIFAVASMLILTITGLDKYIPLFEMPSEPDVQLKKY